MLTDNHIIQIRDLNMVYKIKTRLGFFKSEKKEIPALKNINLEISENQIFGLLGPNGAGKTTLIKCLTTLLIPTSGSATINGYDVIKNERDVRASIGCMLMGERGLYWKLTARENLEFFGKMYSIPNKTIDERIKYLSNILDLDELLDRPVEGYSSGQKMKVAFAKALINDAPIIFLDEPTVAMDVHGARILRKIVKELAKQGKTIVYTSHIMSEIEELCDQVAIIDHGTIIANDTPADIRKLSKNHKVLHIKGTFSEQAVDAVREFAKVAVNGDNSLIIENHETNLLPKLTETLIQYKGRIESINQIEPSLEDVFIEMTGRSLSEDTKEN